MNNQTISAQYIVVMRNLNKHATYAEKHCILNNSMKCKKVWKTIAVLHKMASRLETEMHEHI